MKPYIPVLIGACVATVAAAPATKAPPKHNPQPGIIDPRAAGPDFEIQGEYIGAPGGPGPHAAQVIALGGGRFQAVFLKGGLPGAGWDGSARIAIDARLDGETATLAPAAGTREYIAKDPAKFSATEQNPPTGQPAFKGEIRGGILRGETDKGARFVLNKTMRQGPTMAAKPPPGARILLPFIAGNPPPLDGWTNKDWKALPDGSMLVVHPPQSATRESVSTIAFGNRSFHLHVEFCTPFMPAARGQGRGNSGVFPPPGREIQVLDSFGLDGKPNECGGIYKTDPPAINMCFPPLSWQTYDIHYTATSDASGKSPSYRVMHNGVEIHKRLELGPTGEPNPLRLQDHLNDVRFRNIWVVE